MFWRVIFLEAKLLRVMFSDELSIYIGDCTLRVQGFLIDKEEQKMGDNC